jgi:integrase
MGGAGPGVERRGSSIRLRFMLAGTRQAHTLMMGGEPMPPTPANLRYAGKLAVEIRERIRHGTFSLAEYFPAAGVAAGPRTVGCQLDTWMAAQRIEPSTRDGYESSIRFWKPLLGDKLLRSLRHSDILTAIATRPDLSGKTINNRVSVLREALQLAVLDKLLPDNPAASIPSATWQRPPVDPFTAEEVELILVALEREPQVRAYVACKFFTGLRTSESFGLRWPSVDLPGDHLVVSEAIVGGIAKSRTKTGVSRAVLLNSRSRAALVSQKQHTYLAGQHVFLDPRNGQPWTERSFRDYWVSTLRRLGIRHRRAYNTRHTYATLMLMSGMTPAFCAGQMGHSVQVFLDVYSKWIAGAGDAAEMAKLEARLSGCALDVPQRTTDR